MAKVNLMYLIRPAAGGMKEHLLSLIRHVDRNKFNVFLAYPPDPEMERLVADLDVKVLPIKMVGELNPKADVSTIRQIWRYLRQNKIGILHVHSSKAALVGRIAAILAGTPVVIFTVHNFIFYDYMSRLKKTLYGNIEAILAKFTTQIITVSRALAEGLVRDEGIGLDRITTIYNGVDIRPFQNPGDRKKVLQALGLDHHRPVVGTVARLAPQKGVNYLLDAAKVVQQELSEVQFLIVGDGPLRQELEEKSSKLALTDVVFAGFRQDIVSIMSALDIFVLPSITEGLGITILEAMSAKKPVVASAVGGVPEVVVDGETGLLVPAAEGQKLGKAILKILSEPNSAQRMGETGYQRVKDIFSLQSMIKQTEIVYLKALQNIR